MRLQDPTVPYGTATKGSSVLKARTLFILLQFMFGQENKFTSSRLPAAWYFSIVFVSEWVYKRSEAVQLSKLEPM